MGHRPYERLPFGGVDYLNSLSRAGVGLYFLIARKMGDYRRRTRQIVANLPAPEQPIR